jgi:site-specific DNA recombinase
MEGVLAAFAQFDNDYRSDRTRAGMKASLELGRWVFLAPLGYINAPRAMAKSLMADPERAPLVRRAFEEYATGRFTKEQLLKQTRAWGMTNRRGRPLTSQAIGMLLRNRFYASVVDVPEYGVRPKRGAHGIGPRFTLRNGASRRLGPSRTSDSTRSGWPWLRQ